MKILSLHCDYIKFKPVKKALKEPEELSEKQKKEQEVKEVLVIFTGVEKSDELSREKTVQLYVENIKDLIKQIKAKNIVLYPYAHLSSQLSSPDFAERVMKEAESILKKEEIEVTRAPFGYYKEFELKCKGHPLAELSREISIDGIKKEKGEILREKEKSEEKEYNENDIKNLLREISRTKLDTSKLKENDHRILGQKLDLFSFNETAPGMVFWHDKGLIIYNELINYWREEHRKAGYEEISTPQVMDRKLWEISGHWKLYKENMFTTGYEGKDMAVKPMNCPGGMLVYKTRPRSYKELPLRMAELGKVHRLELSGVLAGLFRVIQFTQDDAHIFCTEEQLQEEIINVVKLFRKMLEKFGFKDYKFTLSVRSEEKKDKYLGSNELWKKAEKSLAEALKKLGLKFETNNGEAKFYGPSLDILIKDSLGREWQCSTLQLDFNLPKRFELSYIDKNNKEKTPIMLHRVVYGSLERFIGVLLEHTNGALPTWLSPIQVRVLSFTDRNIKATKKICEKFKEEGIRAEIDIENKTVNSKIAEAEVQRINYIIVIGDKEEKAGTLAVRKRGKKPEFGINPEIFIEELKEDIKEKK